MTEERLKEIKNIFDMADIYGDNFEIARELYNEVIRLREENKMLDELRNANYLSWQDSLSRIEKTVEFIKENDFTNDKNFMDTGIGNLFKVILKFLEGRSDE